MIPLHPCYALNHETRRALAKLRVVGDKAPKITLQNEYPLGVGRERKP